MFRKDWRSFSSVNIFNKIDIILLVLENGPVLLATKFHSFPAMKWLNRRINVSDGHFTYRRSGVNSGRVYNFAT